ncbi:hypothetical protein DYB25_001098 [Aphanomyces astaci]|uniref:Uncharacterized protein n=1 Tax=Aphanomyces astaci TaxID=112090 RepID=A0A397AA06_APHAT|nr:hypothetical protein DYB36_004553 [Aphanomyces astaci]RHY20189.1 hypothetical protein DYB25_001098 [Aphanomyces astaci]RHY41406.1 hypothetical protein DYB34_011939 [Aphanomyces astaci]
MTAKLREAEENLHKAEKHLKTTMFRWSADYMSATPYLEKAAEGFRAGQDFARASSTYVRLAEIQHKNQATFRAAMHMETAAKLHLQYAPKQPGAAKEYYQTAAAYYGETGELGKAAEMLLKGAAALEEVGYTDVEKMYLEACDLMEAQDKPHFAVDVFRKSASFFLKRKAYDDVVANYAKQILLFQAIDQKENMYKAFVSIVVLHLAKPDVVAADQAYMRHLQDDGTIPKRVLITGAGRGIGLAFAKHFTAKGWHVVAGARTPSAELLDLGVESLVSLDVASEDSVKEAAQSVGASTPIHLVINNAGVFTPDTLKSATKANLMRQYEVNAVGPWLVSRAFLPNLELAAKQSNVAVVAQLSARLASLGLSGEAGSFPGLYGYRTSKTALNSLTRTLSLDVKAKGLACVLLHPGFVKTDLSGHKGKYTADQSVAKMVDILARVTAADNGKFYDIDGSIVPW